VVGEIPSKAQVVAASLIVTGEVVVATFGDHTNDDGVTVDSVVGIFCLGWYRGMPSECSHLIYNIFNPFSSEQRTSYSDPYFVAYLVGVCLYIALLVYLMRFSKNHLLKRFAWGSCGGTATGLQNFLKDSLTIVKATGPGDHYPWFFYLFMAMAGASAFGGLLFLAACMKRYDATYSAASFVGSFVLSASIMSAAHYKTFSYLKGVLNYVLYPVGLLILMVGVFVLVRESKDEGEAEEEELDKRPVRKNSEDSRVRAEALVAWLAVSFSNSRLKSAFDYSPVGGDGSHGNQRLVWVGGTEISQDHSQEYGTPITVISDERKTRFGHHRRAAWWFLNPITNLNERIDFCINNFKL
jgi:hypothetical protein